MRRRCFLPVLLVGAALLGLAFARPDAHAADPALRVVTSIPPLAMIVSDLGGRRVAVRSILPPGADPHTFEPKPSDALAITQADVIVVLGSPIDSWIGKAIGPSSGAAVVRLDAGEGDVAADDHHDHAGHHDDPHVWLDPLWVRDHAVRPLQRALADADPAGAAQYGEAARRVSEAMTDLDDDIRSAFAGAVTRSFLAWHPAWDRFAERYGLHSIGSVGEVAGREPSVRAMIDAIRAARAAGVRAVLVEPQVEARQARVLADELGVAVVLVDPLGDPTSLERSTYRLMMLFNANAFARALGVLDDEDDEDDGEAGSPAAASPASSTCR